MSVDRFDLVHASEHIGPAILNRGPTRRPNALTDLHRNKNVALMTHASSRSSRLSHIDGLRGIAALMVLVQHALEKTILALPADQGAIAGLLRAATVDYVNWGRVGVIVFFCVSGFVVPFSFKGPRPVMAFAISRFFRLYPAYWASLAVAVVVLTWTFSAKLSLGQILANATMLQTALRQPNVIEVYWTLFYELMFYGVCVISFLAGRLFSGPYIATAALGLMATAAVVAAIRGFGLAAGASASLPFFLALMHLGTLARLTVQERTADWKRTMLPVIGAVLLLSVPVATLNYVQRAYFQSQFAEALSIYVALALFAASVYLRLPDWPPLLFLGRISYSLYLFHPLCLELSTLAARQLGGSPGASMILPLTLASTTLVSALVFRFVEAPAVALGHRLAARLGLRQAGARTNQVEAT